MCNTNMHEHEQQGKHARCPGMQAIDSNCEGSMTHPKHAAAFLCDPALVAQCLLHHHELHESLAHSLNNQ